MRLPSYIIIKVDGKIHIKQLCNEYCYVALPNTIECPYKFECRDCNKNKKEYFGKTILKYAKKHNWFGDGEYRLEVI